MSEEELLKSRGKTFIIHVKLKKYYIFFLFRTGREKKQKGKTTKNSNKI